MSELNTAKALFQKTISQLNEDESKQVKLVHVALGELSELNPNSIQTHWKELSKGTPAEQSQLHFRLIPAEVQCMACFKKYQPKEKKILCPYCGSFGAKILTGEECYLESIETE